MRRVLLPVLVLLSFSLSAWAAPGPRTAKPATVAQRTGLGALLSGRTLPLSRKLKSLNKTWRRFTLSGSDQGSIYTAMYGLPGAVYYTKGETVSAQGETYLVAYAPDVKMGSLQLIMMGRSESGPEKVTAATPVRLALLNLRTMGSMTDIRAFNLKAEIASFNTAFSSLQSMSARMSSSEEEAPEDKSLAGLKSLALAGEMYMADYDTVPPTAEAEQFRAALDEYVGDSSVFKDPENGEFYLANASLSGKPLSAIADANSTVLVYQAKPGKDGRRGVGFVDGHVKKVTEAEWQKLRSASGIK